MADHVWLSGHAIQRMFERSIPPEQVDALLAKHEVIEEYPDDYPYPSWLIFGMVAGRPLHAVLARDASHGRIVVVTVYIPTTERWEADWKRRKSK